MRPLTLFEEDPCRIAFQRNKYRVVGVDLVAERLDRARPGRRIRPDRSGLPTVTGMVKAFLRP